MKKKTIEDVKPAIELGNEYELLSDEYINNSSKLKILHKSCGDVFWMSWKHFNRGQRCPECSEEKRRLDRLLPFETVKSEIESFEDYKLLSEEYINSKSKLEILHSCKNVFSMSWSCFNAGQRCPKCDDKKSGLDRLSLFETVKREIESFKGYKLLSEEYIGIHSKLEILHSCGEPFWMTWGHFQQGQRCKKCHFESISGENHHNWNPNLTDEEREQGRKLQNRESAEWRKAIFERDDHTCQKCLVRGGSLEAHHILPWALFPELRFEVENGITLCKGCHKRYHKVWGKGEGCNHKTLKTHLLYNHDL